MTTKLSELIAKLPTEFQPIARRYADMMIQWTIEQQQAWIDNVAAGNWQPAYESLVQSMTTAELLAEQQRINNELTELNTANAAYIEVQKQTIKDALSTLMMIMMSAVM